MNDFKSQKTTATRNHRIVVSIINFRTADLTIQCVRSVLDDLEAFDGHVVVVDNRSDDGSAEIIEKWIAGQPENGRLSLVRSPTNSGFSGGHNQGMAACHAEFVLVLNSDAIVRPGFFAALIKLAQETPTAGILAPCIEYDDGGQQVSCFRFPSIINEFVRAAHSGPISRLFAKHSVALTMPPNPEEIDWASFACILLRMDMVREIGPMDEGYFLYFEDVEYCWRARRAGWQIAYVPDARAVHFRGGSGPVKKLAREKKRLPAYYYASRTRFFRQTKGPLGPILANLAWLAGRMVARLRLLLGKVVPATNQSEFRDIWTNVLMPLGDRHTKGE